MKDKWDSPDKKKEYWGKQIIPGRENRVTHTGTVSHTQYRNINWFFNSLRSTRDVGAQILISKRFPNVQGVWTRVYMMTASKMDFLKHKDFSESNFVFLSISSDPQRSHLLNCGVLGDTFYLFFFYFIYFILLCLLIHYLLGSDHCLRANGGLDFIQFVFCFWVRDSA